MSDKHFGCRGMLKYARYSSLDEGIKPPAISSSKIGPQFYAVFLGNFYEEYNSCCSYYARYQAINDYVDLHKQELKKRITENQYGYFGEIYVVNNYGESIVLFRTSKGLSSSKEAAKLMEKKTPKVLRNDDKHFKLA